MGVGAEVISAAGLGTDPMGGLDLHTQEAAARFHDEVVAIAIAPGTGDSETHGGSFAEEGGLGYLSTPLSVPVVG
jgi:hypothetical protein